MEDCLPTQAEDRWRRMGIAVTDEQDRLEEDHAGVPHGWGAAEQGSAIFANMGCTMKRSAAEVRTVIENSPCVAALSPVPAGSLGSTRAPRGRAVTPPSGSDVSRPLSSMRRLTAA